MEKINQSDKISSDNLLRKSKYLIKKIVIGKLKELYILKHGKQNCLMMIEEKVTKIIN
jgi:hypothetical protein